MMALRSVGPSQKFGKGGSEIFSCFTKLTVHRYIGKSVTNCQYYEGGEHRYQPQGIATPGRTHAGPAFQGVRSLPRDHYRLRARLATAKRRKAASSCQGPPG